MNLLRWFKSDSPLDPFLDPDSFGNIALEKQYITSDDLRDAIQQQEKRLPLGEILVLQGKLTLEQRDDILLEQDRRRATSLEDKATVELRYQRMLLNRATLLTLDVAAVASGTAMLIGELKK